MNYQVLINKAEDYMENNLSKRIKLEDIADAVRSGIYLVVNKETSITEIAYRYGYCDASSYNKAFKKHYGCSPSEFRNRKNIQVKE